ADLAAVDARYRAFDIPKRDGRGRRRILAPAPELKAVQRRILRRVLALLVAHPAATGFERGQSIVTNARRHAGRAVVVRLDIVDFFPSTTARRVHDFFRRVGWSREAARRLTDLCTRDGGLPQGAPTSPRLANLVNYRLDTRLARLADVCGAVYTRYADDLCFSTDGDDGGRVGRIITAAAMIAGDEHYRLHRRRKRHVRRRHQQQRVTGLVVNDRVGLPRTTRRRLRAIEHHLATGRPASLTEAQLAGWRALRSMIETQR
ncbi:MAG: reverse transcriptase family protein, partial [Planctomycetota bacterium]